MTDSESMFVRTTHNRILRTDLAYMSSGAQLAFRAYAFAATGSRECVVLESLAEQTCIAIVSPCRAGIDNDRCDQGKKSSAAIPTRRLDERGAIERGPITIQLEFSEAMFSSRCAGIIR